MRVLHIHSGNLYGGVETLLLTLARNCELCPEVDAEFALCFEGRLGDALIQAGATVRFLGPVRVSRPHTVWRARRALLQVLERGSYDCAVVHSAWSQSLFAPVLRRAAVPQAFYLHDVVDGRHWLQRWARRSPPQLLLCNSSFTQSAARNLYRQMAGEVVYYPVRTPESWNAEQRESLRRQWDIQPHQTVILQAGRLEPLKGYDLLLRALGQLRDLPGWICWIVGGAQRSFEVAYTQSLKQLASDLQIRERVRFLGHRTDLQQLLSAADIYAQPNREPESFGLSLVEALHARLPVVTSALGGAAEIVNGTCGQLLPPQDVEAVAAALRRLILSPQERAQLGAAGPGRAEQLCSLKPQLDRLYDQLSRLPGATA